MKKTQKKLGNQGFSLVELIVVIAIMAVLVGVLAPTLIRNVEKSRESTDMQTLDSIKSSVTTALSLESVNNALAAETSNTVNLTLAGINSESDATSLAGLLKSELSDDGVLTATWKSKAASATGNNISISITKAGKVSVSVVDSSNKTVTATNLKQDMSVN